MSPFYDRPISISVYKYFAHLLPNPYLRGYTIFYYYYYYYYQVSTVLYSTLRISHGTRKGVTKTNDELPIRQDPIPAIVLLLLLL